MSFFLTSNLYTLQMICEAATLANLWEWEKNAYNFIIRALNAVILFLFIYTYNIFKLSYNLVEKYFYSFDIRYKK